ncbi:hypothetical protein RJJ65_05295 [Rhizobium hidalgonense]|uniref:TnsA endonuclease N-terminal domain-containing protein n=1 Tax=Rhizobium hidalgonense TaxID=1538159 RepID=A0AAJ2LKF5_9HYPH|nr:hypothetical protein [Rhizobium hidalgonense]MDR9772081.1 hypothetical protein [Rhizobium hidalgonense]MDR9810139.1 hypothetical protein [Rhizobium hidalgonense]
MTSIPFETPPGDVDPRQASPRFFYPLATIKRASSPIFRSQDARDFACLLDVDPDVVRWTCVGVELSHGGESHLADFVVTGIDDRTFVVDVAHDLPNPPDWIALAAERAGHGYRPVAMADFAGSNRLLNAKDLLRYGFYRCPLGDRVRILAALDEMGSLTVAEALSAFREGRPMACLAALILQGFLEIEMDEALIGPETVVRRIRD